MDNTHYIAHHGIEGQKWGVRNGPPYPLVTDPEEKRLVSKLQKIDQIHKKEQKISSKIARNKAKQYRLDNKKMTPDRIDKYKKITNKNSKLIYSGTKQMNKALKILNELSEKYGRENIPQEYIDLGNRYAATVFQQKYGGY